MLVVNMAHKLRMKGHVVDVCVFDGAETPLMQRLEQENPGIRIWKLGHSVYNPLHIIKLMRLMRKYDVVHSHNSSPQLFVAIAGVLCSVGLCSTEHTTSNRKRGWKWYAPIESWMYNRYNHVVCISKIAEEKLCEYMGGEWLQSGSKRYGKVSTINNGVDVDAFYHAAPLPELAHEGRFVTVMVAGFREAKDQDTVIRAMALLPEGYELWLVGDGIRRPELEQLIVDHRLEDKVRLLGVRSDVAGILKSANVTIMSSHWEGLSLSNVEGMSSGKPFIASDVNGLREVTRGYGILFEQGNAQQLADIIQRLRSDAEYYNEVAEACYHRAMQFDVNKMVAAYEQVYKKIGND